jgi:hypothetical protein
LTEALWEGDQEEMKRSGGDEPMWVVIQMYMEVTQGISLYSYLYLKLGKTLSFSCYFLCFFSQHSWRTRGRNRFCPEVCGGKLSK